LTPLR